MATERAALAILNTMEDELGLNRSSGLASTSIPTRQRLAFMNATLEDAYENGDWSGLEKEAIFEFGAPTTAAATLVNGNASVTLASTAFLAATPGAWLVTGTGIQNNTRVLSVTSATVVLLSKTATAGGASTLTFTKDTFAFPTDFGRWIPQTQWDSGLMWEMVGPTSSQFDAFQRNGIVGPYPRRQFRRQGPLPTAFRIFPPPSATGAYPGTLSLRYYTNEGVTAVGGATKRYFTVDTDLTPIPDRLLILGAKWRWQQAKGFDFGPLQEEYYNWFDSALVGDSGQTVVPLNGCGEGDVSGSFGYNVPDGNYPGS